MAPITVCISDDDFSFFPTLIDPTEFETPGDICNYVRKRLVRTLRAVQLEVLAERAARLNLHAHGAETIEQLLEQLDGERKIFVCSHSH